jgi:pimeloyl-ACP methyl ester carboxylesterase
VRRLLLVLCAIGACRAAAIPEARRFPAGTPFTARYLQVEGTSIRYIDAGHGIPVVLLHGLGASMYAWRKNLTPITAAGFRVIAFDNRGFGFSDKPPRPYDNAAYARLAIALMDSLQLADAVLVGHSMGGAIAAEVAIEYPQRVRGLVLIGSAGLGAREPLLFRVARWPVIGPASLAFRGRGLTARLLKSTYADPTKVTEADVDQYYAPMAEPEYGRALRGVLRQFQFDGLGGRLERIAAPTLVLWGEEDRWIPLGVGRALAHGISRSAFLSVPHAGHSVQEEAPDEVNRLLLRFLMDGLPRIPGDLAFGR